MDHWFIFNFNTAYSLYLGITMCCHKLHNVTLCKCSNFKDNKLILKVDYRMTTKSMLFTFSPMPAWVGRSVASVCLSVVICAQFRHGNVNQVTGIA